jgi:hypothetical protein
MTVFDWVSVAVALAMVILAVLAFLVAVYPPRSKRQKRHWIEAFVSLAVLGVGFKAIPAGSYWQSQANRENLQTYPVLNSGCLT